MASKVLVKLPAVPFPQTKKTPTEMVALGGKKDGLIQTRQNNMHTDRATQLEQNMKFLQEQHQATLMALHKEVETLRQRNRDLQFQIVLSNGSTSTFNGDSSLEDNSYGSEKTKDSPTNLNKTPLQVELLQKDLEEAKASLKQAQTNNKNLSDIIQQQKRQLELLQAPKKIDSGVQVDDLDYEREILVNSLENVKAMTKQLKKQNIDQKREIAALRANSANLGNNGRGARSRESNNSYNYRGHDRGPVTAGHEQSNSYKFPPLMTQFSWQHRRGDCHRNSRHSYDWFDHSAEANALLPQLPNQRPKPDSPFYEPQFSRHPGIYKYRKNEEPTIHRDRRDPERYNRRNYNKDINSNDS
ncbi:girdin-like [Prorops nasuta]|uniref:girdin-like n=1 Tax=Prorops nasuta TaxID=863751 RepID=UPI0034CF541D